MIFGYRAIIVGGEAFEALGYVVDRCVSRSLRMSSGGRVVLVPVIVVIPFGILAKTIVAVVLLIQNPVGPAAPLMGF